MFLFWRWIPLPKHTDWKYINAQFALVLAIVMISMLTSMMLIAMRPKVYQEF